MTPETRTIEELLDSGYYVRYHPGMGRFYTYHPSNEKDTFGGRGASRQQIRNLIKRGVIEQVGSTGEIFKRKD